MKEQPMSDKTPMGQVIQIDEARIRDHLGEMVRGTVEETLNAMLDAEADQLCGAGRYERSQARQDTRAGSYERTLQTSAGEVNLKVPKLRRQTFETAIIDRYRRRESSVEEALIWPIPKLDYCQTIISRGSTIANEHDASRPS